MKYIVVLCDGMADLPVDELSGKTPMMAAFKPNMDFLAEKGHVGLVKTVAEGLSPGSDVANLSVMGYDPKKYYSGRSPLEAVSMGVELNDSDVALRCNLVTLSHEDTLSGRTMVDYCAGDISSQEAHALIEHLQQNLGDEIFSFYGGVSYRHCLVWSGGAVEGYYLTPPHDITGQAVAGHLPEGEVAARLLELMEKSYGLLKDHPVNLKRISEGKNPANSIWLWGQGRRPVLPSFERKFGLKGSVVSAVDLLKGIGICAGMDVCKVEGATGYLDTNFEGKTAAVLRELERGQDFVYLHLEAPDECGHRHEIEGKVKSIEYIDKRVLEPLLKGLERFDDYKIMLLPDHPTPLATGIHSAEAVPYLIYHKRDEKSSGLENFNEESAARAGDFVQEGHTLIERFLTL